MQRDGNDDEPSPDGTHRALCEGLHRFHAVEFLDDYPFLCAKVEIIEGSRQVTKAIEAHWQSLKQLAFDIFERLPQVPRYLVARQLDANGLTSERCKIAVRTIIRGYTREAGCRNLEREIAAVFRHIANGCVLPNWRTAVHLRYLAPSRRRAVTP